MSLAPGARLGPYEIVGPIGTGGMGEVYKAHDTKLDRDVALKVLPSHLAADPEALARFEREAKAVAALSHPNILAIHDFGSQGGTSYAVTELLEGETLRARLAGGSLPLTKTLQIATEIAQGVAAAHEKRIVHRDLKPENVFVATDGRVKILDFGLARHVAPLVGDAPDSPTELRRTDPGMVRGTVGYMSPEQVRGQAADERSDIFSLGCVLFELATGRRPFQRDTVAETMTAILREDAPEVSRPDALVPAPLEQLVRHCLEKRPEERFQSARDLAFALQSLSGMGAASAQLPASTAPVPRRPSILVLAAVGLLLAGAAFVAGRYVAPRNALPAAGGGDPQIPSGRPLASYPFYPVAVSKEGFLYIDKIRFMEAVRSLQQTPDAKAVADLLYLERKENVTLQLGEADRGSFQVLVRDIRVPDFARQEAHRDRLFEVFKQIVNGLGQSFAGTPIEIVLHDVRNPMQSIQALQNPISGRRLYQPTTNFGLELIKWYATHPQSGSNFISYDLVQADGTALKSTTIPLYDQDYGLLGFVCMNIRLSDISETRLDEKTKQFLAAFRRTSSNADIAEIVDNAKKNLSLKRAGE